MTSNPYATPESDPRRGNRKEPEGHLRLAGFWIRCAGCLIDSIAIVILFFGSMFVLAVANPDMVDGNGELRDPTMTLVIYGILFGVSAAYIISFTAAMASTPGKLAVGVYIVDARTRKRIGLGQALGRYFGSILSNMFCSIGYLIAAFTERRQTLHDLMANTYVVHRER